MLVAAAVAIQHTLALGACVDRSAIHPVRELAIVGGGAASPTVHRALEDAAGVRVVAGAVEAAALGNALLQGLSLGRFSTLGDARAWAAAEMATAG